MCDYLNNICKDVKMCILVQDIVAQWQELVLAFINTINAIKSGKNIARKHEYEFYIRFFAERQINTILNNYLAKVKHEDNYKILLIHHDEANLICLKKVLDSINNVCRLAPKPEATALQKLYLDYIESHLKIGHGYPFDKAHRIVLGIISCGNVLIKD